MRFNYKKEKKEFEIDWEWQKSIMIRSGMSEKKIAELYLEDWERFKADRNYLLSKDYIEIDEIEQPSGENLDGCFHLFEDMESESLLEALKNLKYFEKQIVLLKYEKDLTIAQIAVRLGNSYDSVRVAHGRVIKKLKKILNVVPF